MAPSQQKKAKTTRAQRAELDKVINALENENKEMHTTQSQSTY